MHLVTGASGPISERAALSRCHMVGQMQEQASDSYIAAPAKVVYMIRERTAFSARQPHLRDLRFHSRKVDIVPLIQLTPFHAPFYHDDLTCEKRGDRP